MMPNGLINTLNKDEVLDLIAYLQSGGDPESPVFRGSRKTAEAKPKTEKSMFTEAGHTVDSIELVKERVANKSAVLLDVREQNEWDAGHLTDAQFLPLSKMKDPAAVAEALAPLPKDKPIYLHCRSGGRVLQFADLVAGKGYDIRPLKAGYERLVESGFTKAR